MLRFVVSFIAILAIVSVVYGSNSRRHELLDAGYVEEASLFHRIFRKDGHQVDLPYHNNAINTNWLHENIRLARKHAKENKGSNSTQPLLHDSYWDFVPAQMGTIWPNKPLGWKDACFHSLTATLTINNSQNGTVVINAAKKDSALCSSFYMLCTRDSCHLTLLEFAGAHTLDIQWAQYEYDDVTNHGMWVFLYPLGLERTMASVAKTLSLFYDPYKGMVNANVQFLAEKLQWAMVERQGFTSATNISASDIKSGDYLAIGRLDGLDPLIMWGTGGHTGHTAIALWFDGELYICESTDTEGAAVLTYWPPPYGIIRTPFNQWVQQAMAANYHVAILRLAPQYLSLFNETAANQWFYTVQGMPYGWHNFLFTFIDTVADNLPRPVTPDLAEVVAGVVERLIPIDAKSSIYNMLIQGLNFRLNSNCTTMHCIYQVIDPMNMTLTAAASIPELDSWRYGGNYSMVCDVFVCEMYKNAGIFGSLTNQFQCTEHTPKDTYQWAIWDANWIRPQACIARDPQLPYCQLMGEYVLTLPGFNSIPPYANMNNACPSLPPVYYRPPIC